MQHWIKQSLRNQWSLYLSSVITVMNTKYVINTKVQLEVSDNALQL